MQRVGIERFAQGPLRNAIERSGAEKIDDDRADDDGEGRRRRFDRMGCAPPSRCTASQITTPESKNRSAVSASAVTLSTLP